MPGITFHRVNRKATAVRWNGIFLAWINQMRWKPHMRPSYLFWDTQIGGLHITAPTMKRMKEKIVAHFPDGVAP